MKRFIFALVLVFVLSFSMCSSPAPPGGGTVMLDDTGSVSDSCCGIATSPPTGCLNCCTDGLSRYKCVAIKNVGDAVGAKATIRVRLGQLCGDLSRLGQMGAWVGIQQDLGGASTRWCQAGYMCRREPYAQEVHLYFFECYPGDSSNPTAIFYAFSNAAVVDSDVAEMEVVVNPNVGEIDFVICGDSGAISAPAWLGMTCQYAVWCGEIAGRESDMPGTVGSTCDFTNCAYWRLNISSPTTATFDNTYVIDCNPPVGGQPDEWRIGYAPAGSSLEIWDEYPL